MVVQRAGDVIPQIVAVMTEKRTGKEKPFKMPDKCPVCGAPTHREPGVAMRYCTNAACPAQLKEHLHHFVARGSMDIDGLGSKLTDRFVDLGWTKDAADIFNLDWKAVSELEGLGEKSAAKLQAAVEESKSRPLERLINALGIRHVGERTAGLLADRFGSIDDLMAASFDEINSVAGIGEVVARSVYDFFQEPRNRTIIEKLRSAGVRLEDGGEKPKAGSHLSGLTFVLTGRLEKLTRPEAEERLRRAGANRRRISFKENVIRRRRRRSGQQSGSGARARRSNH